MNTKKEVIELNKQSEKSNTTDKQSFLIDNEKERLEGIEGTPFGMLENKENGKFCATLGNYRFDELNTKEEVKNWVNDITWNKIMLVITIMNEFNEKNK